MQKVLITAVLVTLAIPALAADFSKPLLDGDGKPICNVQVKDGEDCPAGKGVTLGQIARAALYNYPDEPNAPAQSLLAEKLKRGDLAQSLVGSGEVKLKSEEITLIKNAVAKVYPGALLVWSVTRELEPPK